jgi:alkanesulfonate monooxygenase SsuD/methylene tetrahydromethanopterin reductase-like flavin-dependent oxidoreductase (luciferase family)
VLDAQLARLNVAGCCRLCHQQPDQIDLDYALKHLARFFGQHDFSQWPLDQPPPDLAELGKDNVRSAANYYARVVKEEGFDPAPTRLSPGESQGRYCGTPAQVADTIQRAFEERAADGFILITTHNGFRDFTQRVVPLLRQRGLYRTQYEHDTLRGHLGLP